MKLKGLLFVLLLTVLTVSTSTAQLQLSGTVGYGAKINKNLDYSLYQSTVTSNLQQKIDRFSIIAQGMTINSDSTIDFYGGLKLSYDFWAKKNKSLAITAHGLIGEEGKKLSGLGLIYTVDRVSLNADVSQEYKNKELFINLGIGYAFLQ